MYQAIVIACMMADPNICITFEGQQWFDVERTCKYRALQMASDVHRYYMAINLFLGSVCIYQKES